MKKKQEKENSLDEILKRKGEKYFSIRRIIYCVLCFLAFFAFEIVLAFTKRSGLDVLILCIIITAILLILFVLELRNLRLFGIILYDGTSYRNIFIGITLALIIGFAGSEFNNYLFPAAAIAIVLTAFMDMRLSLTIGLFINIVFTVLSESGIYVFMNTVLLLLIGAVLSDLRRDSRISIVCTLLIVILQAVLPEIFYYFERFSYEKDLFYNSVILGLIDALLLCIIFPLLHKSEKNEKQAVFENILDDDYSLVSDIRHFSVAEYEHARRVERASRKCAELVNADSFIAAAGGFYYKLGVMYGEPERENAIKAAIDHCFPKEVIEIISEYKQEDFLPKTKEEAIVNIVSEVITRLELIDSDTLNGGWNKSMVIIKLCNDRSAKGIYDDSGLGLNQFLKIRDYLSGEDLMKIE